MFRSFFENRRLKRQAREAACHLLVALHHEARQPVWYLELGVEDTFDGRFDLVTLYLALVLYRMKQLGRDSNELQNQLIDVFVADIEINLREMGVGDTGLNHKVKKLLGYVYGRLEAYEKAQDDDSLALALRRNLWREEEDHPVAAVHIERAVACVQACRASLAKTDLQDLNQNNLAFSAP